MDAQYRTLGFAQAIEFLRGKANVPTERWDDMLAEEHDWAFVVAGAAKAQLLADLRAEVERAIGGDGEGGEAITREEFTKNFEQIATNHGWNFKGGRDWRANTIYGTNLATAYAAGRWEQQHDPDVLASRPYLQWVHSDAPHARPEHLALDGQVFAADDPFWDTMYPPTDWGCGCRVVSLSDRDLARLGKSGPDTAPEIGSTVEVTGPDGRKALARYEASPAFANSPGRSRLEQRREVLDDVMARLPDGIRQQFQSDMEQRGLS